MGSRLVDLFFPFQSFRASIHTMMDSNLLILIIIAVIVIGLVMFFMARRKKEEGSDGDEDEAGETDASLGDPDSFEAAPAPEPMPVEA